MFYTNTYQKIPLNIPIFLQFTYLCRRIHTMKVFVLNNHSSNICQELNTHSAPIKEALIKLFNYESTENIEKADVVLIEEKWSYKDLNYKKQLLKDPIFSKHLHKIYSINIDDNSPGFLKGLYVNISNEIFDANLHRSIPFLDFYNEEVFKNQSVNNSPKYLAAWRGNPKSNPIRQSLINHFSSHPKFNIESTESWLNHSDSEKSHYKDMILNAQFSLCPSGWGPASFRVFESMALGRCPVIVSDKIVLPKGPIWEECSITVAQKDVKHLESILMERSHEYETLGKNAHQFWKKHFQEEKTYDYCAEQLNDLIVKSLQIRKQDLLKRWNSYDFLKKNEWTIQKKVMNKFKKILKT